MIENVPMEVRSRCRLYTSQRQRNLLNIDGYGHGTDVHVGLTQVDRSPDWGHHVESVTFDATLGVYGEIRVPEGPRERLDLDVGDAVRASIAVL